jgi:large subunit ribosomal protein L24
MKLQRDDKVLVLRGRDKGKTGTVLAVLPATHQVVIENLGVVKRHTKPSQKNPRGGILEIAKPIDASKVMVLDPVTGKPARIGYEIKPDGSKERVFKPGRRAEKTVTKKTAKSESKSSADKKPAKTEGTKK